MHHSEILLQLDRRFGQQYISPAEMKEQFEYNCGGAKVSIEEVAHEFRYLLDHNIIESIDDSFNPTDRFELSDYWGQLSDVEKDGWYSTATSSPPIDL